MERRGEREKGRKREGGEREIKGGGGGEIVSEPRSIMILMECTGH